MIKEKLEFLLSGFLPGERVNEITEKYGEFKDLTLAQLGVDSLSIMGLILRLQEICDIEIDYENFKLSEVETLAKIEEFVRRLSQRNAAGIESNHE
jgi:acyl carrier protein